MATRFGVHVGNSSAYISMCKDEGRVDLIANDVGDRMTPSVVQWTTTSCIVGRTAELELFRNSSNTIVRNKQLLKNNVTDDELDYLRSSVPYKINRVNGIIKYEVLLDGKQHHINPIEIATWIFKKIFSIAQSAAGESKELNAVIAAPLYYSQKSVHLVKEVAKKAGFNVLQVVDEPSAAALGCGIGLDSKELPYYCLIYRVGGVTVDATILLVQDGMFSVINSVHKYNVGGSSFTQKLSEFLASEFRRHYKNAEISERGIYKLLAAAETIKQVLSIQNVAQCSCESIGSGYDLNCSVSRARYENIISTLIPEIVAPITEVLNKANLNVEKIKKVVTCGGTLKTPKLQEIVQKILYSSEIINTSPDEVIAIGAGKQAGYCSVLDHFPDSLFVDTPALSTSLIVTVKQEGSKEESYVIPQNTSVPYRRQFDVVCEGKSLVVTLGDDKSVSGVASLNTVEPSSKVIIDVEINKEAKVLLTLIHGPDKEKTFMKNNSNGNLET